MSHYHVTQKTGNTQTPIQISCNLPSHNRRFSWHPVLAGFASMLNQFHSSTTEVGQNSPGPLGPKGGGGREALLQFGQLSYTKSKDRLTWGSTPLAPGVKKTSYYEKAGYKKFGLGSEYCQSLEFNWSLSYWHTSSISLLHTISQSIPKTNFLFFSLTHSHCLSFIKLYSPCLLCTFALFF